MSSPMSNLLDVFDNGQHTDELPKLIKFVMLAARLKNEILSTQKSRTPVNVPPSHLHDSAEEFLKDGCGMTQIEVRKAWKALGTLVWGEEGYDDAMVRSLFAVHGEKRGYPSSRALWPPTQICLHPQCPRTEKGMKMQTVEIRTAVLHTMHLGPIPVNSVHLECNDCKTTYYVDYQEHKGVRRYYMDPISNVLQISDHDYAERKLIESWRFSKSTAWTSSNNCAAIYRNIWNADELRMPTGWTTQASLDGKNVTDGFVLLSLLLDCQRQKVALYLPHGGSQRDRHTLAMQARSDRIRLYGQDGSRHRCSKCVRMYLTAEGEARQVFAVVMDGVTVGRPRCGDPYCKRPLAKNRDRFCPFHQELLEQCCIVGCYSTVREGKKTCAHPDHVKIEDIRKEVAEAPWQLTKRVKRSRVTQPESAEVVDRSDPGYDAELLVAGEDEVEETFEEKGDEFLPCAPDTITQAEQARQSTIPVYAARPAPPTSHNHTSTEHTHHNACPSLCNTHGDSVSNKKLKAVFGVLRTHNEQLLVCPCGIIMARETFFHSESIPSCVEFIKRVFGPDNMPDHIVFDNNCTLAQHVRGNSAANPPVPPDPAFSKVGLAVDVFHFKCKHSKTDTYCRENCDPHSFPELRGEDGVGWWFNTSIAEQTNVWFGGYHSSCREMTAAMYDFFLDEMILIRNEATQKRLEAKGVALLVKF